MDRERRNFLAAVSRARRAIRTLSPEMEPDESNRVFLTARRAVDRAYDWSRFVPGGSERASELHHEVIAARERWEAEHRQWMEAQVAEARRAAHEAGLRERDRLIALGKLPPLPDWLR